MLLLSKSLGTSIINSPKPGYNGHTETLLSQSSLAIKNYKAYFLSYSLMLVTALIVFLIYLKYTLGTVVSHYLRNMIHIIRLLQQQLINSEKSRVKTIKPQNLFKINVCIGSSGSGWIYSLFLKIQLEQKSQKRLIGHHPISRFMTKILLFKVIYFLL